MNEEIRRLREIAAELAAEDPRLAEGFRRWRVGEADPGLPGGSTVPPWVAGVFLTAAVTWTAGPVGAIPVAAIAIMWILVDRNPDETVRGDRVSRTLGGHLPPHSRWPGQWP